jgi:RNA polymerase sigma factor (sigma-70 family)
MVGVVDHTADVLSVDEAVTALETQDPRKAAIVKLRFFAGLTVEEIAAVLEIAPITVKRDWRFAKAWLMRRMDPDAEPNE